MEWYNWFMYVEYYNSPIGKIKLESDGEALVGLWFVDEPDDVLSGPNDVLNKNGRGGVLNKKERGAAFVLEETKKWLDIYFKGDNPGFLPKIKLKGSPFRIMVWEILKKIPYGKTLTYGEIAKEIAKQKGIRKMSAQAVGGAVGKNPVSIIIPCHRVLGADMALVGYSSGLDKKIKLLELEKITYKKP